MTNLTGSSLDETVGRGEIQIYMVQFKTIMTFLLVWALAIVPAASASAAMHMAGSMGTAIAGSYDGTGEPSETSQPMAHAGCEDHAQMAAGHQDANTAPAKGDQGSCPESGCVKCPCLGLAVAGILAMPVAAPSVAFAAMHSGWATPSLLAPSILPPSPPPRV